MCWLDDSGQAPHRRTSIVDGSVPGDDWRLMCPVERATNSLPYGSSNTATPSGATPVSAS